ncbi:MAG: MFS transporter [Candidatus Margulisbacteria bacterium]|nr:MFS transporter [Candidatus Margulisiibacteriota bacterium]
MLNFLKKFQKELLLFIFGIALVAFGESIVNSTLNNFLHETFNISSFQRTFLEFPRELPGLMVVFISTALFFLPSRRLAVFAGMIGSFGLMLIAFFPTSFSIFCVWIFFFSAGQHLLLPLSSSIGMELAHKGQDGKRLGQMNSIRNLATILGSFFIFLGFNFLHLNFKISFIIAAVIYLSSAIFFYFMKPGKAHAPKLRLKLHKEYKLYYWLSILFGTRKQIFLTFAPWVLVTIYHKPTAVLATLLTIGGVAGIVFQPILGKAIDKLGEKTVLIWEAVSLVFVCLGYGFAKNLLSENLAFILVSACFVADQLLMSVNMARATYLKKIATHPDHITPTLTMSVTIDHVFSILVAILGGIIWMVFGFQYVFLFGGFIAILNFISALRIKIPEK